MTTTTPSGRRSWLIFNPHAGSGEQRALLMEHAARYPGLSVHATSAPGDATRLAGEALDAGVDVVIAAGGDGTVNEVVQGLAGRWDEACLLIVPMGTGNDLARSLELPLSPDEALGLLDEGLERRIDLIRLEVDGRRPRYSINVSAGGLSDVVDEQLDHELKATWGALSYLRAAASIGLGLSLPRHDVRLTWDDGSVDCAVVVSAVVANGRTAAGGIHVAPHALVDDGQLDVVCVLAGSGLNMAGVAAALAAGDYTQSSHVLRRCTRSVRIEAEPPMWFNVDGERFSNDPITFTCLERAVRVLTPPQLTVPSA